MRAIESVYKDGGFDGGGPPHAGKRPGGKGDRVLTGTLQCHRRVGLL